MYEGVFAFKEIRTERFRGKWPHAEIILTPFRKKMKKKKTQNDKRLTAGELGQEHTTLQPSLTSINLNIEMTK